MPKSPKKINDDVISDIAADVYKHLIETPAQSVKKFLDTEASGGIILVCAALLAILVANSPLQGLYHYFLETIRFSVGFLDGNTDTDIYIEKPILLWVNDGFMAIFFFLVGLEIKREITSGELSAPERTVLPVIAAIGGVIFPALIYWYFNKHDPVAVQGWAIPAATDIAFALGVLSLLGSRVPVSLKVLLTAVAIIDDLCAIVIIALFYTESINGAPFIIVSLCMAALCAMRYFRVEKITAFLLIGMVLWAAVLKSGVHATLAGVVLAMFIPMTSQKREGYSPLKHLEHNLHPWVALGILPLFAFANAGVSFAGMQWEDVFNPVSMGIALGLVVGKQIGVFVLMAVCILLRFAPKPEGANWLQLYGVSILCGIGFTMSLFIGGLSFESPELQVSLRVGVIFASIVSAVLGILVLYIGSAKTVAKNNLNNG